MYNLPYFKEGDQEVVLEFMRKHPFVFLTGVDEESKPVATQVPVFIDERDGKLFLTGHIMRNNDHHKAFERNPNVLAVFTSPHVYVSATWYDDPHQASTWNYMSVHARGRITFLEEEDLRGILRATTEKYEQGKESLASYHHLQPDYINKLIKAIVGFRVVVGQIENVFKLSQNRDEKSFHSIMEELRAGDTGAQKIAGEMERIKDGLFNK